jgi:hypothetical protein
MDGAILSLVKDKLELFYLVSCLEAFWLRDDLNHLLEEVLESFPGV